MKAAKQKLMLQRAMWGWCPFCESREVEGVRTPDIDQGTCRQEVRCVNPMCGAQWYENYKMVSVEFIEEGLRS